MTKQRVVKAIATHNNRRGGLSRGKSLVSFLHRFDLRDLRDVLARLEEGEHIEFHDDWQPS